MESKTIKILAIDDNFDNRITIKALINEAFPTATVLLASSGRDGLKLATAEDPDVILLDVVMPEMDGFEVCQKLKSDKLLSDIPVVFVTALKGEKESRIRGLEVGAEAFLAKPIDESELVAQIRAMAKIKKSNIARRNENVRLATLVNERTLELKKTHSATLNLLEDLRTENEERRKAERNLQQVARLYAVLSQINQAIVRTKTSDELFKSVCQLAIDYGQFQMGWIGIYDEKKEQIVPYTFAGNEEGYLENIQIFPYDSTYGKGAAGAAFREQKMQFCNDIATDPLMEPWRDEALKRGYRSIFSTPILLKGNGFGVLTLYASEINSFNEEEQKLLTEVGEDISHAIDAIDAEIERELAEKALIESEAKYREFVENSPEAIAIYADGIVTYVNKECVRLMKAQTKAQLIGMQVSDFIHPDNRELVFERMKQIAESEVDVSLPAVEEKYMRLDGSPIFVEVKVMPLILDNKPAVQLTARDITERKKVEDALEQSRIELKTIYDHSPVMMCLVNQNKEVIFANEAFEKFTKNNFREKDEIGNINRMIGGLVQCVHSFDSPNGCGYGINCKDCELSNSLSDTFKTGKGHNNIEYQTISTIDNNRSDVFLLASTARIQTREEDSMLICLSDITERKLAEDALQKSETLLRTFIDNSPFEIWARDNDSVGILENKILVNHYGSIIGQTPDSDTRIDSVTTEQWKRINERAFSGEMINEEYEFDIQGDKHTYQQIVFPIKNNEQTVGIAGFNIDITDRKIAEEKIRENNLRLEMAMQVANMAWWEMNVKTGQVSFGKQKTDMLGFLDKDFKYYNDFMELVHSDDCEETMAAMHDHLYGNESRYETEYRIRTSNGTYKWFYDVGSISKRDENGNPLIVSGLVLDITDRKEAESELATQKRFFEQMFMQSSLSTQILDKEGWCERINPKLSQIFGVEAKNMEGKVYNIFRDEEMKERGLIPKLENVFNDGKSADWEVLFDIGIAANSQSVEVKEKKKVWYSNWAYPIFDQDNEVSHVIIQHNDITDRKSAEEALHESQEQLKKFAAHLQNVREEERNLLAREIHDDLGQILIAIKIDIGLLKQNILKTINEEDAEDLKKKFEDLHNLVDSTLKSARRIMTDLRPEVLDLLGFIETVNQYLKSFRERYKIECTFVNDSTDLKLNSQQSVALFRIVQEALNNVAKHSKATKVKINLTQQVDLFSLEIEDNGIGFDVNSKKNMESYGLIGMKERVFLLEGELIIHSKKDVGTTIKIVVPYSNAQLRFDL